ncbi:MAG TPA: hypothetical protein VJ654_11280 [Noviherbaspirillum sp.]|nr:hypothetical protein [Noviherbaspirillum sp.]
MKIYLDTEFTNLNEFHRELISIGLVSEEGMEFYAERNDYALDKCSDFVKDIVLPKLGRVPDRVMSRNLMRDELRRWLSEVKGAHGWVEICYDFIGDWQLMRELLDCEIPGWITYHNVYLAYLECDKQKREQFFANAVIDGTGEDDHHALFDARALRLACSGPTP